MCSSDLKDLYAPGLYEYTLMPMHLHTLFTVAEMKTAKLREPFDFTKGMPILQIDALMDARRIPIHDNKKFEPGVGTTLYDLQADPYNGGSLVFSALAALAGMAVTPSLLMLKAVAVGWNALGLALWMRLAERVAGLRKEYIAAKEAADVAKEAADVAKEAADVAKAKADEVLGKLLAELANLEKFKTVPAPAIS